MAQEKTPREILDNTIDDNHNFLEDYGQDIQGNIFSPHRYDHVLLLFLHLTENKYLRPILNETLYALTEDSGMPGEINLTTTDVSGSSPAKTGYKKAKGRRKQNPNLFCNLFFTLEGLKSLIPKENYGNWGKIFSQLGQVEWGASTAKPDYWDLPYRFSAKPVHAVMLLAHPAKDALLRAKAQLFNQYFPRIGVDLMFLEWGQVYRQRFHEDQRRGFAVEHFGYADGLSNPWVTREDTKVKGKDKPFNDMLPVVNARQFLIQEPERISKKGSESPSESADPAKPEKKERWGSILVYRKYEQHVDRFSRAVKKLVEKYDHLNEEEAGALIFGRRKNGTSLEVNELDNFAKLNDFNFEKENLCPLFAHTRKMNPRNYPEEKGKNPKRQRADRAMLRRGVTYGKRRVLYGNGPFDNSKPIEHPVGLLFMSFQRDINSFLDRFNEATKKGEDPLLNNYTGKPNVEYEHKIDYPDIEETVDFFHSFVTLRGGFNLYAPSISFFRSFSAKGENDSQ